MHIVDLNSVAKHHRMKGIGNWGLKEIVPIETILLIILPAILLKQFDAICNSGSIFHKKFIKMLYFNYHNMVFGGIKPLFYVLFLRDALI